MFPGLQSSGITSLQILMCDFRQVLASITYSFLPEVEFGLLVIVLLHFSQEMNTPLYAYIYEKLENKRQPGKAMEFYFQYPEPFLFFICLVLLCIYIFYPCNSCSLVCYILKTLLNLICTWSLICVGFYKSKDHVQFIMDPFSIFTNTQPILK